MSRPLCSILLSLSAVVPSAALALGLGDLHVESALGQDFRAHIDLIDLSPDDLARLQAAIADDDTFQRHQLQRPAFLLGTTVAVGHDAQGRPVLKLRSTESFSEPVVTFLVDVQWRGGELIREYSALLDPAELTSKAPDALQATHAPTPTPTSSPGGQMVPASATATAATKHAAPASGRQSQLRSYTVTRGDTLARVASIVGARSGKERHRMMIAIYRANPAAFQSNLNALHTRAVLRIPSVEELQAISLADAEHEYQEQVAAWHGLDARRTRAHADVPQVQGAEANRLALDRAAVDRLTLDRTALAHRVESLEQSLQAVRRQLQERTQEMPVQAVAAPAAAAPAVAKEIEPDHDDTLPWYRRSSLIALIGGLALMLVAGLWWIFRRQDAPDPRVVPRPAPKSNVPEGPQTEVSVLPPAQLPTRERALASGDGIQVQEHAHPASPAAESPESAALPNPGAQIDTGATTATPGPEIEAGGDTVEHKFAFYNPESHADTTHVVMGSDLTQPLAFVERRKNPAIVLQQAIEREPSRSDLHLKLLELYYASAAENRLAFLEAARQIMQKGAVSAEDWARIADMGRRIAPDDELFANDLDDQAVA